MSSWKHPILGRIELIPSKLQPKKVWAHFYAQDEHWERLTAQDLAAFRKAAEEVAGVSREEHPALPRLEGRRWSVVGKLLREHHTSAYGPAYLAEMASSETRWTPRMDPRHRHLARTPRGVLIIVQLDEPSWVVTAYRPHPLVRGVVWTEEDFGRQADWRFEKETSMNLESLVRVAADNLVRAAAAPPASVRDLWWLASAVGYGRLFEDHAEIRAGLPSAETLLHAVAPSMVGELLESLDWDGLLTRIASGLEDDRPEELEASLCAAEELLVLSEALDDDPACARFLARVEELLAWLPPEWGHLAGLAAARGQPFDSSSSFPGKFWESVADLAMGAAIRESAPVVWPPAMLVEELLQPEPTWKRWPARLAGLSVRASAGVREWVSESLAGIAVVAPVPAMGVSGDQGEPWQVRGRPAPGARSARVFVVDYKNPDGYEVTAHFVPSDGYLWSIDQRDEEVLVILVAGDAAVEGNTLDEVLAAVARRSDVHAGYCLLTPPR